MKWLILTHLIWIGFWTVMFLAWAAPGQVQIGEACLVATASAVITFLPWWKDIER